MNGDAQSEQSVVIDNTSNSNNDTSHIISVIEDNSGGISAVRVLMFVWGLGVLAIWGFAAISGILHGIYILPSIPESLVTVLLGIVGGKVIQRFGEK